MAILLRLSLWMTVISPARARQNVKEFVKKYKSNIFLCNVGSPTLEAYLDLVKRGEIFVFFPVTGGTSF